jgi:hypothetical protein
MKADTIELPSLKRMPEYLGGHVIYKTGEESICPEHKGCAYTGDEKDRCPFCHSISGLCDEDACGGLPPGRKQPCFCNYCGELFTSPSSFDQHQRPAGVCRNPAKRGLVLLDQNGWQLWGKPGSRPEL